MSKRFKEWHKIVLLLAGFCAVAVTVIVLCVAAGSRMPDTVGRTLTGTETAQTIARNSPLTEYVYLSPNADFPRQTAIRKVTIHHMAGDLTLEELGRRRITPLTVRDGWGCMWRKATAPGPPTASKTTARR